jgi:hypothetical protein
MPRKIRTVKAHIDALPSPAWTHLLLTGTNPNARIAGWVVVAQSSEADADEIWERHSDALIAEAMTNGFRPYYVTKRCPTGPHVNAWSKQFVMEHQY